jgi:O-antigen/teichoic acid export membrane protein
MLKKLSSSQISQSIAGLFASNLIAYTVTAVSYIVYSKSLQPSEFGLYSIALMIGSFGNLVLDGGIKNTIIKSNQEISQKQEGILLFLMIFVSFLAITILFICKNIAGLYNPSGVNDYNFLALFSGIYWLSYPWIAIPTASLEKSLNYTGIAWVESVGIILERAFPAVLILSVNGGIHSFIWSLFLSRIFRIISVNLLHRSKIHIPSLEDIKSISHLLGEGVWLQLAVIASLVRDNLHTIFVGVLFGKAWVGFYSWAIQLSFLASQLVVGIIARVSIPFFAKEEQFESRWRICIYQIKISTIIVVPFLIFLLIIMPQINTIFWQNKWATAISILPLLFLRMLTSLANTPISSILMVQKGGRIFANAVLSWTVIEIILALFLLVVIGPMGLAWSYAIAVWTGLYIMLYFLSENHKSLFLTVSKSLLKRQSIFISIGFTLIFIFCKKYFNLNLNLYQNLFILIMILVSSYYSESDVRKFIKGHT